MNRMFYQEQSALQPAVSEKLMEHKVPHYLGMWAGNKIYLNQITGQQEYDNTMDTWMNLSLQKERGMGLKNLIAEKSHSNYRQDPVFYCRNLSG